MNAVDQCSNQNTKVYQVRFDDLDPVVTVAITNKDDLEADKPRTKAKLVPVDLAITVSDNCDEYPETTITVYSDEKGLGKFEAFEAFLERQYSDNTQTGVLEGWGLLVSNYRAHDKECLQSFACEEADGRFFVVQVCATDLAGQESCAEDFVGVPPKGYLLAQRKGRTSLVRDDGLYVIAQDTAKWDDERTGLASCQAQNLGLDTLVDPELTEDVYCGAYAVSGPRLFTDNVDTAQECGDACAAYLGNDGCGTYTFTPSTGVCNLYGPPGMQATPSTPNPDTQLFVAASITASIDGTPTTFPTTYQNCPFVHTCNEPTGAVSTTTPDQCSPALQVYGCGTNDYVPCDVAPVPATPNNVTTGSDAVQECAEECVGAYGFALEVLDADFTACRCYPYFSQVVKNSGDNLPLYVLGYPRTPAEVGNEGSCSGGTPGVPTPGPCDP